MVYTKKRIPARQRAAYFQLVEHPILAMENLYHLYYYVAWNRRLAPLGDVRADEFANLAEMRFKRDQEISAEYHAINGGKWDGMMLQTHIGYTTWQQPEKDVMPEVKRTPGAPAGDKAAKEIRFERYEHTDGPGAIGIDATRFARAHGGKGLTWRVIPNLGQGAGAVSAFPQGQAPTSQADGIHVEYDVIVPPFKTSRLIVDLHMVPTLNTSGGVDVRIGVSVDDGPMQPLSMRLTPSPDPGKTQEQRDWERAVIDNDFVLQARFSEVMGGRHVIKVWRLDDNALLTKLVLSR
jgi:hypothetical protein